MLKTLLVLGLAMSSAVAHASSPRLWIVNPGGIGGRDQVTDGKTIAPQEFFGGSDVRALVRDNPQALELAEEHASDNIKAHVAYWLGVLPTAVVLGVGAGSQNTGVAVGGAVGLVATSLLTAYFVCESRRVMFEAINLYNGVGRPEEKTTSRDGSAGNGLAWGLAPASDGGTVMLGWRF